MLLFKKKMNNDCWQNLCSSRYENVLCDLWCQTRFLICCTTQLAKIDKNSAIRNCWIGASGAIKLHTLAQVPRHTYLRSVILLPVKDLSSYCIVSTFLLLNDRAIFDTSAG